MTKSVVFGLALLALVVATPCSVAQASSALASMTCAQAAPTLERLNRPKGSFRLNPVQLTRWIHSKAGAPRGVVLVIHGLEIRPSRMNDIGNTLADSGFDVLRVALSGHRGSLKEMRKVTHESEVAEEIAVDHPADNVDRPTANAAE